MTARIVEAVAEIVEAIPPDCLDGSGSIGLRPAPEVRAKDAIDAAAAQLIVDGVAAVIEAARQGIRGRRR